MASSSPTTDNNPPTSTKPTLANQVVLEVDISDSPTATAPLPETASSTLSSTFTQDHSESDMTDSESEEASSDEPQHSDPSHDEPSAVMPEQAFTELLQSMNRLTLNRLDLGDYDQGERRLIDRERCRRKALQGPRTSMQPLTLDALERRKKKRARKNNKKSAKAEYDGEHLHEYLTDAVAAASADDDDNSYDRAPAYDLVYAPDLGDGSPGVRYGHRENKALFFCYVCRPTQRQQDQQRRAPGGKKNPRVWTSSVVFTEYWICPPSSLSSSSSSSSSDLGTTPSATDPTRYKVLIHSQKCRCCERYIQPKLMPKKFVQRTLWAFDLWTGRRDRIHGEGQGGAGGMDQNRSAGPPHDSTRCHGCEIGKCRRVDQGNPPRGRSHR